MINWISLKEIKPEKPTSINDANFKSHILFISGSHVVHARRIFFGLEGFKLLGIADSEFGIGKEMDLIDIEEFTHWTKINVPE